MLSAALTVAGVVHATGPLFLPRVLPAVVVVAVIAGWTRFANARR